MARTAKWAAAAVILLGVCLACPGIPAGGPAVNPAAPTAAPMPDEPSVTYIQEDAIISGKKMTTFLSGDQVINVIVGNFRLTLGKRAISGANAVMWIHQHKQGQDTLRDMEIYVEGEGTIMARVTEPDGTTTTDRVMDVTVHQQGPMRAKAQYVKQLPEAQAIFDRAEAMRTIKNTPPPPPPTLPEVPAESETQELPYQVEAATSQPATAAAEGELAATGPASRPRASRAAQVANAEVVPVAPGDRNQWRALPEKPSAAATKPAKKAAKPAPTTKPKPYQPPLGTAESITFQRIPDPSDPKREIYVGIAKGNVFIGQGNPDSDQFLGIQADAAVLYFAQGGSATQPASRAATQPGQPAKGMAMPNRIVGAYLTGDVILRRGERTVQSREIYYDFENGRAIMLQPVIRTVQEDRNIPLYVRAEEARQLAAREGSGDARTKGYEWSFRNAVVTTSDFYTPSYSILARKGTMTDTTTYDDQGVATSNQSWRTHLENTTFRVGSVPILWFPWLDGDSESGHTAMRKMQLGKMGQLGWGFESSWFLFRLLGLSEPQGVDARLEADWYQHGFFIGPHIIYNKPREYGYLRAYYEMDSQKPIHFGTDGPDITPPANRGWFQWRHKEFLPQDWELQGEISYMTDQSFLREFFPADFWTDKPQETLVYAKKQKDNWALTGLMQFRLNDWETQTQSYPDLAGYLVGQSLWNGLATWTGDVHAGIVQYKAGTTDIPNPPVSPNSPGTGRVDTRQEIDAPLALGPVKMLPSLAGRGTYWSETPEGDGQGRGWGQGQLTALTHAWRVYDKVENRMWDLHRLRHEMTPYAGAFWSGSNVDPTDEYAFSPEIEQYVRQLGGGTVGVRNRLQTMRGRGSSQESVDWMRFDIHGDFFNNPAQDNQQPADGRYFFYAPEYSINRNSINDEYSWHISDSTTFLFDSNYDIESNSFGRADVGFAVQRDPRFRYYVGTRYIGPCESNVGTLGMNYALTKKYEVSFFEQYDFKLDGGRNNITSISLIRKFPRVYTAVTFVADPGDSGYGLGFSIWPEGVPQARIGGNRMSLLQAAGGSDSE